MLNTTHAILVPLDGSPAGEHALPAAISVARVRGAALNLAYVVTTRASSAERQRAQRYLDGVAQRLHGVADITLKTIVLEDVDRALHHGEPGVVASPRRAIAHALAVAAEQPDIDLVVMTTHSRNDLARFWLGSVTEHLIHHVPEPILLVHPRSEAPNLAMPPAFRRILVPIDGSKMAEHMVAQALAFGKPWGAQYLLLHIIDLQFEETISALGPGPLSQSEINGAVEHARVYLEQLAAPLREQQIDVVTEVLAGAPAASVILDYAAQQQVDLIAIKTHGRSGFFRLVIGSTANKVLRAAQVPVLLHRPNL